MKESIVFRTRSQQFTKSFNTNPTFSKVYLKKKKKSHNFVNVAKMYSGTHTSRYSFGKAKRMQLISASLLLALKRQNCSCTNTNTSLKKKKKKNRILKY